MDDLENKNNNTEEIVEEQNSEESVKDAEALATEPEVSEEQKPEEVTPEEAEAEVKEPEVSEEPKEEQAAEEDAAEPEKKEEEKEEEPKDGTTKDESKEPEEEEKDESANEPSYDELKAKLADLEEEKEVRVKAVDFVNLKKAAEQDFDNFCGQLQASVETEFKRYNLDTSKTLGELPEAEKQIAMDILSRATALKEQKAMATAQEVDKKYHELVFTKAEKVFKKFPMTPEQEEVAARTFIRIVKEIGVQDIGEDIVEKVKFSVARAMMEKPVVSAIPEVIEEMVDKTIDEAPEAESVKEAVEEVKEEAKIEEPEPEVKPEPKADIADYAEGIVGNNVEAPQAITEDNVIEKLAALPYNQRTAFYKEHYDLLEAAARKASARRK